MRINFKVNDTCVDFEMENWPSGQPTISHTCPNTSPRPVLLTTQIEGPPLKRRHTSTADADQDEGDNPWEKAVASEETVNDNSNLLSPIRRDKKDGSSHATQDLNDEVLFGSGKKSPRGQGFGRQPVTVQKPRDRGTRVKDATNALVLYPLEVRDAIQASHELARQGRAARSSSALKQTPLATSSCPQPESPLSAVFLLTYSHSSELSYTILGAFVHVEDANFALLDRFQLNHLDAVYRPSNLWNKTETLTPPRAGIAWWIDELGALAIGTDDDPPDDHVYRVIEVPLS